jgi:hypothetical protein
VEEQREHALQAGVQIGRRLLLPGALRRDQLAPAEDRRRKIAVDPLVRRQGVIRERAEPLEPGARPLLVAPEGVRREIVESLVVGGEAEAAREHRGLGELLLQEGVGEIGERRHGLLP